MIYNIALKTLQRIMYRRYKLFFNSYVILQSRQYFAPDFFTYHQRCSDEATLNLIALTAAIGHLCFQKPSDKEFMRAMWLTSTIQDRVRLWGESIMDSTHREPVMRTMCSCHDIIMKILQLLCRIWYRNGLIAWANRQSKHRYGQTSTAIWCTVIASLSEVGNIYLAADICGSSLLDHGMSSRLYY